MANRNPQLTETDVLPSWLPANPSFLIDARREPNAPGDGNADVSPTDLAPYRSTTVEQQSAGNEPIWNEDPDHWSLDGTRFWNGKTYRDPQDGFTIFFVGDRTDTTDTEIVVDHRAASGNSRFRLRTRDSNGTKQVQVHGYGESSNTLATVAFDWTQKSVIAARFDPKNDRVQLWADAGNGVVTDAGVNSIGKVKRIDGDLDYGRSWNGRWFALYEMEQHVSDNNVERTMSALKNIHDIDESAKVVVEGIRTHREIPATPDVHIDARKEVNPPGDGNGDARPLNLPVSSDLEPDQGTGSSQPIYREPVDALPYWEFGGDDYWREADVRPRLNRAVFACVFKQTTQFKYVVDLSSNNTSSLVGIRADTGSTVGLFVGTEAGSTVNDIAMDTTYWTVVVATVDTAKGESYLIARNANGDVNSGTVTQTGKITDCDLWIGRRAGGAHFNGLMRYPFYSGAVSISKSAADRFCKFLARDHGIIE